MNIIKLFFFQNKNAWHKKKILSILSDKMSTLELLVETYLENYINLDCN